MLLVGLKMQHVVVYTAKIMIRAAPRLNGLRGTTRLRLFTQWLWKGQNKWPDFHLRNSYIRDGLWGQAVLLYLTIQNIKHIKKTWQAAETGPSLLYLPTTTNNRHRKKEQIYMGSCHYCSNECIYWDVYKRSWLSCYCYRYFGVRLYK